MIKTIAFKTKARTVDHLGREQIADTPTAISELWKNSFDAYARNVSLDLYQGDEPVASICDDGHGMNREEFETRWLVVGTESKATSEETSPADRNGLAVRPRQGQKGIGRLSCANLGPILLLVSKRRDESFVASLLDWRLFENPFVNLSDIQVPVTEFAEKHDLLGLLSEMTIGLAENVTGGSDPSRAERLGSAWKAYDRLVEDDFRSGISNKTGAPSAAILGTLEKLRFEERHLSAWPVWNDASEQGTLLLVSEINYDLRVELDPLVEDTAANAARDRFFETLTSFVDPFFDPSLEGSAASRINFSYSVRRWNDAAPELMLDDHRQFDRRLLDGMEHVLVGTVDPAGVFQGKVKAFGKWYEHAVSFEPPGDLVVPTRADTALGPFEVYIASMEFQKSNTTLEDMEFTRFRQLADRYSGFMIFRDGLRVLPYGRTDNDFFEIESRRSFNAGREFWNHRQMFGRLAISRSGNPNLKDKAGREGLLDNRAAKTLKVIVSNILRLSARRYFGSDSKIRAEILPQVKASNKAKAAGEARNKLRQKQRKEFRTRLQAVAAELPRINSELERFAQGLLLRHEREIVDAQQTVESFRERLSECRLPGAPKNLGTLESSFNDYREQMRTAGALLSGVTSELDMQIERLDPTKPRELLERQLARNTSQVNRRLQHFKRTVETLQKGEYERLRGLIADRGKIFQAEASPLLERFDKGDLSLAEASKQMENVKEFVDATNEDLLRPYVGALEALRDSIDLENLASFDMEELSDLRAELERLNALAQLGIAVEIVGHELQSYDEIIGSGLRRLPAEVQASPAMKDIQFGYDGLTDQLRFLSPLRLAGQRIQRWITGQEIYDYLNEFFGISLTRSKITFSASDAFKRLRVFDQQSRLFPVFINLVNNSIYWLSASERADRCIVLDRRGDDVLVSDSGPGIDAEDVPSLFTLFFTRKTRGGRGVGLYLSRANLAAGGHRIRYQTNAGEGGLSGANFIISFRGVE